MGHEQGDLTVRGRSLRGEFTRGWWGGSSPGGCSQDAADVTPACRGSPLPVPGTQDPVSRQRGRAAQPPRERCHRAVLWEALHSCCAHHAVLREAMHGCCAHRAVLREAPHGCCAHRASIRTPALPATRTRPRDPLSCRQTVSEASVRSSPTFWGLSTGWGHGSPPCLCPVSLRALWTKPAPKGTALTVGLNSVKIHCQNEAVYQYHVTFRYRHGHGGPGSPRSPSEGWVPPGQSPPCLSLPPSVPVATRWSGRRSHGACGQSCCRAAKQMSSSFFPLGGFLVSCVGSHWGVEEG